MVVGQEAIDHIHVSATKPYIVLVGSPSVFVNFHDEDCNDVAYTGNVEISVTHPAGFAEFTRGDPYWNGQEVVEKENEYRRGAMLNRSGATPEYGTTITIPVYGETGTYAGLAIYTDPWFGDGAATVTASAAGKSDSDSVTSSDMWFQGRATTYKDTADNRPDYLPYLCAIPHASWAVSWLGRIIQVRREQDPDNVIQCQISNPGPLVPWSPHYPPSDVDWNHYWDQAGWPPLAVSMDGKWRAEEEEQEQYKFNEQIIDIDWYNKDENGESAASRLGFTPDYGGTVQWCPDYELPPE